MSLVSATPHTIQCLGEVFQKLGELQRFIRNHRPLPKEIQQLTPSVYAMKERFLRGEYRHTRKELQDFRKLAQWIVNETRQAKGHEPAEIEWPD